jgi:predicted ribosomally synthesized peptide with SipW-like signal peptide
MSRTQKTSLSIALLLLAAALAGIGAYATFTDSASANHSVTTGTVSIDLGATGASTNRLNVDATAVAPGDTMQRSFDLSNSGSLNLSGITLTTNASTSSLLDTNATDGLQMVIDRCSNAWTESGSSPAFTYTCSGSTSTVVASRAVIGSNIALSNLTVTTTGNTDHLRLTLTLPTTAGNVFQGLTSTVAYSFTGIQRAATDR